MSIEEIKIDYNTPDEESLEIIKDESETDTYLEGKDLDELIRISAKSFERLSQLEDALEREKDPSTKNGIKFEIERTKKIIEKVDNAVQALHK